MGFYNGLLKGKKWGENPAKRKKEKEGKKGEAQAKGAERKSTQPTAVLDDDDDDDDVSPDK